MKLNFTFNTYRWGFGIGSFYENEDWRVAFPCHPYLNLATDIYISKKIYINIQEAMKSSAFPNKIDEIENKKNIS